MNSSTESFLGFPDVNQEDNSNELTIDTDNEENAPRTPLKTK